MKERRKINKLIRKAVKQAVREAILEKTEPVQDMPVTKPFREAAGALGGLSAETARLCIDFVKCFGIFITLLYAVRQLMKEIKTPF